MTVKKGETVKVLAASDMAVVTSGTATLQTAFLEVPMVVVYKLSPLTYHLGKRIIKVKHISLVNILSGREVVAELIQHRANPKEIINELKKIMSDANYREDMLQFLQKNQRALFRQEGIGQGSRDSNRNGGAQAQTFSENNYQHE